MKKRIMLSLVGMLLVLLAQAAALTAGKYYRFYNVGNGTVMYEDYLSGTVRTANKSTSDWTQLWLWTGKALQNVYTSHYIQPQPTRSTIFETGLTASSTNTSITTHSNGNLLINCGGYLHKDGSNCVVNWSDTNNTGDQWTVEPLTITDEKLAQIQAEYAEYAQGEKEFAEKLSEVEQADKQAFCAFFEDAACTQLRTVYAGMSDVDLTKAITDAGLPAPFAEVALKVKNQWSSETDASMSKEFRVQDYGAYAIANSWRWNSADGRGLNASQISDMNNPTGIYTNGRDILYVFVEGEIPSNCYLHLCAQSEGITGFDRSNYDSGTELHTGMNIIASASDLREYWVMYSCYDKTQKLAELPKLKIHIEGGHVMGYVTYNPADEEGTNTHYERILRAANASADASGADKCRLRLAMKGVYGMCYWQIMTYNLIWSNYEESFFKNTPSCTFETEQFNKRGTYYGFKIWKSAKFYDDVLHQEWATMGFMKDVAEATQDNPVYNCYGGQDLYPTYVNNLAITIMGTKGGNPHSSTGYTHMPGVGAVESSYNGERSNFDVWCVGHESGHNNQGAINLQSSTESSNNLFSQIITYFYGYRMGRGGSMADNEDYFQKGVQFSLRDIGMTMRMYYNLYLYYHTAGFKRDFYPLLFNDLRSDAMNLRSGSDSWLKFYKKACRAAGEDLTEYFRLWGFFVPFNNVTFGDYTSYTLTLTQSEINQAIAEVKAEAAEKGWKENLQIMFIEDRQQLRERTDLWAEAEKDGMSGSVSKRYKPDNGGTWRTAEYLEQQFGSMGDVLDFQNPTPAKNYSYCLSGTTVNVSGEGGVGLLLYDEDGKIIAHSNSTTFTIPAEVAASHFTLKVVNADGTAETVNNIIEVGTEEQQLEALQLAVNATTQYTRLKDTAGKRVGCYSPETLAPIEGVIAEAKTVLSNKDASKCKELFEAINEEMLKLADVNSMIHIEDGGIYVIESARNSGRYIGYSGTTLQTLTSSTSDVTRWAFVPADKTGNNYFIQNAGTGNRMVVQYPYATSQSNDVTGWGVTTTFSKTDSLFSCRLMSAGDGKWFLKTKDGNKCINVDGSNNTRLVPWSDDEGSKFYITRYKVVEAHSAEELEELIAANDKLVKDVCNYSVENTKLDPQITDSDAPNYVWTNQAETDAAYANNGLEKALDNKATTWFTTKRVKNTATTNHYVAIDLGEGNETNNFKFYLRLYKNNNELQNGPAKISVRGKNPGKAIKEVTSVTPTYSTTTNAFTSNEIISDTNYRQWYLYVSATSNPDADKNPYFSAAIINFYAVQEHIDLNDGYASLDKKLISTSVSKQNDASSALKGFCSPLTLATPYSNLKAAYDALLEAASEATGIGDVKADDAKGAATEKGIFDLSGRRVSKAGKGIYIINGKKILY